METVTQNEIAAFIAEANASDLTVFEYAKRDAERMLFELEKDSVPRTLHIVRQHRDNGKEFLHGKE